MSEEPTHASFFSGVGGLDLGLERSGWRTVSFSEIDPYACAVLAERWPDIPNLGDITDLAGRGAGIRRELRQHADGAGWTRASLWSGGFPCQDLSVAGRRAGLAGERSGLAFAFLDLVERHRPPAVLVENVPGLLSSHRGRDMAALLGRLVELRYGVAYRVLDARHFGVPQRRRRVFILGLRGGPDDPDGHLAAERAAEVLAVGTRCRRHPPAGGGTGTGAADGAGDGTVGTFTAGAHPGSYNGQDAYTGHLVASTTGRGWWNEGFGTLRSDAGGMEQSSHLVVAGPSPDARRVRAPDGLAGRLDDREVVVGAIQPGAKGWRGMRGDGADPIVYVKVARPHGPDGDGERWDGADVSPTLNGFDVGDSRVVAAVGTLREHVRPGSNTDHSVASPVGPDDPLLPLGLDSHRYRCCGNGVVSNVAEWIGRRLIAALGLVA